MSAQAAPHQPNQEATRTWTIDNVFLVQDPDVGRGSPLKLPLRLTSEELMIIDKAVRYGFRDRLDKWWNLRWEFCCALQAETSWIADDLPPYPGVGVSRQVLDGVISCPLCDGTGKVTVLHRGRVSGIELMMPVGCRCLMLAYFREAWASTKQLYPRFAEARLNDLAPHSGLAPFRRTTATNPR